MASFNATESGRQPFIIILRSIQLFISRYGGDGGNMFGKQRRWQSLLPRWLPLHRWSSDFTIHD